MTENVRRHSKTPLKTKHMFSSGGLKETVVGAANAVARVFYNGENVDRGRLECRSPD